MLQLLSEKSGIAKAEVETLSYELTFCKIEFRLKFHQIPFTLRLAGERVAACWLAASNFLTCNECDSAADATSMKVIRCNFYPILSPLPLESYMPETNSPGPARRIPSVVVALGAGCAAEPAPPRLARGRGALPGARPRGSARP